MINTSCAPAKPWRVDNRSFTAAEMASSCLSLDARVACHRIAFYMQLIINCSVDITFFSSSFSCRRIISSNLLFCVFCFPRARTRDLQRAWRRSVRLRSSRIASRILNLDPSFASRRIRAIAENVFPTKSNSNFAFFFPFASLRLPRDFILIKADKVKRLRTKQPINSLRNALTSERPLLSQKRRSEMTN